MKLPGLLAGAAVLAFLSFTSLAQDNVIVVGQVIDQTGLAADATRDFVAGAKTYFDHVNSTGGVNGQRILHRLRDDGGDPEKTVEQTRVLLEEEKADVLFGYFGDANVQAVLADAAFKRSGIAMLGAVSGLDHGSAGENAYFTRASYATEAQKIIEQFGVLGIRRFAVAHAPNPSARATARVISERLAAAQLSLTLSREFRTDGAEPRAEALAILATQPQVIIVLADSLATAAFIKAYRPLAPATFVIALSGVNHVTIRDIIGPKLATGTLLTQVVPDPFRTESQVVVEHLRLMKKFRDEPPSHLTLEGFLAAKALVQALRQAPRATSRADIARALRSSRRNDLGGLAMDFSQASHRGFDFVDIAFLRKDGSLLR